MDFLWHLLAIIGMTIPNALGYNLIFGKGKIFHFGPIGISVFTAYVVFLVLGATESFLLAFIAGLIGSCIISSFFAWLSLRLEPDGLGVMSIALHLAILSVVLNWTSLTRGALGIPRIQRLPFLNSVSSFAIAALIIAAVWVFFLWRVDRSFFGRQLSALAENDWHAGALGISRTRTHFLAFLIGGIGALLSAFLLPQYLTLLHPNDYTFPILIFLIMIVVAGKPGSVWGVTLSTVLLVLLKEALRFVPLAPAILGPVRLILFGLILFVAVWVRRETLFPQQRRV